MVHRIPAVLLLALSAVACGAAEDDDTLDNERLDAPAMGSMSSSDMGTTMSVEMRDANGRSLGMLQVADADSGLLITGQLSGLAAGERGLHIHQVGTCEAPFTSAGDHWNPTSEEHGHLNPEGAHHGDLMNITVRDDSTVMVNARTAGGMLRGGDGLLDADGAALVLHASADDYRTDPDGNAGDRIACGVLRGDDSAQR